QPALLRLHADLAPARHRDADRAEVDLVGLGQLRIEVTLVVGATGQRGDAPVGILDRLARPAGRPPLQGDGADRARPGLVGAVRRGVRAVRRHIRAGRRGAAATTHHYSIPPSPTPSPRSSPTRPPISPPAPPTLSCPPVDP